MQTNLAYIDSSVEEALEREAAQPDATAYARLRAIEAEDKQTVVAGFQFIDTSAPHKALQDAAEERKKAIGKYHGDREEILAELARRDITPLAMLPTVCWDRICTRSGLYRLSPDKDGTVAVDADKTLRPYQKQAARIVFAFWTVFYVAIVALTAFIGLQYVPSQESLVIGTAVMCWGIVGAVVGQTTDVIEWSYSMLTRRLCGRYRPSHADMLNDFFPDMTALRYGETKATLVLPTPPEDVAAVLLKAHDMNLRVAAVGDAIAFVETPTEILRKKEVKRFQDWSFIKHCPIVYCEHESAIAVLAQFGDFPVEEEVVNEVVNSEHLI